MQEENCTQKQEGPTDPTWWSQLLLRPTLRVGNQPASQIGVRIVRLVRRRLVGRRLVRGVLTCSVRIVGVRVVLIVVVVLIRSLLIRIRIVDLIGRWGQRLGVLNPLDPKLRRLRCKQVRLDHQKLCTDEQEQKSSCHGGVTTHRDSSGKGGGQRMNKYVRSYPVHLSSHLVGDFKLESRFSLVARNLDCSMSPILLL